MTDPVEEKRVPIKSAAQIAAPAAVTQLEAEIARRAREMKKYESEQ